jgi:hypothetical protein
MFGNTEEEPPAWPFNSTEYLTQIVSKAKFNLPCDVDVAGNSE